MGIKTLAFDGRKLTIGAPLANNINHQQSAFGGSLFSLAALAGWGLLQLKLGEERLTANTVIAGGEVSYLAPVLEDFTCESTLPAQAVYTQFLETLKSNNRAKLKLESDIFCKGVVSMKFEGRYVISRK